MIITFSFIKNVRVLEVRTCSAVEFGDVILKNPDFPLICTLASVYLAAFFGEPGYIREV